MNLISVFTAAATFLLVGINTASMAAPVIEISFSKRLEKRLEAIDRVERIREERFRRTLVDEASPFRTILGPLNQQFRDVNWAGEMLIPDLGSFGTVNLLTAMIAHNLALAVPEFEGSVKIHIRRLKVSDHSVASLRSQNSYVMANVEIRDASGTALLDDRITVNFVLDPSVDSNYQGPDFAFAETDENDRIGPTLAYFVERTLERAWPDHKSEIAGPIIIRFTGPNETIIR